VHGHKVLQDGRFGVLRVYLKYFEDKPVIRHLERVSRPGRRRYVGKDEIPRVRNGLGMAILSTSAGMLSDRAARSAGVGGEVMARVW
jgi:small subunit ribosomal protein S8